MREHRVQAVLDGVPIVLVQCGVVVGWLVLLLGGWDLSTALLVTTAVAGFDWFGRVAGAVITEAPGTRMGRGDVPLRRRSRPGRAPAGSRSRARDRAAAGGACARASRPAGAHRPDRRARRRHARRRAGRPDGAAGRELVLLLGQIGSGKSSLLGALAGLVDHTGGLSWNGVEVGDPQAFLRPGRIAYVGQVPRVLSGSFAANLRLDHAREPYDAVEDARLGSDVADAGGLDAIVGHRGVRLSGGQVQRLALARALATSAELVVADDVSSALDARTEVELWQALRSRGTTVLGSTSKRAALQQADLVVVLEGGRVVASGSWSELSADWGHLAG